MGNVLKVSIEDKFKESGNKSTIYVDYMNIVKVLSPGDIVFVDDGLISLKVTEICPTHLTTGWFWVCCPPPHPPPPVEPLYKGHVGDGSVEKLSSSQREQMYYHYGKWKPGDCYLSFVQRLSSFQSLHCRDLSSP